MISIFLLQVFIIIIGVFFFILPVATISSIPIIGSTISDILYSIIISWNTFMISFPYAQTLWDVFLFVIIPFEISVLILKLVFGSRTPIQHH